MQPISSRLHQKTNSTLFFIMTFRLRIYLGAIFSLVSTLGIAQSSNEINPNPPFDFSGPEFICEGECITFQAQNITNQIGWEWNFDGGGTPNFSTEQEPTICFSTAGVYNIQQVIFNTFFGSDTFTMVVTVYPTPIIDAGIDTTIDIGSSAILDGSTNSPGSAFWSPTNYLDCSTCLYTTAGPTQTTLYTLTFIDTNSCQASDDKLVSVIYNNSVGLPTAFSPNGDGNNDILFVDGKNIDWLNLKIYNRFGNVVFESSDQNIGWDGLYLNNPMNTGVFFWILEYELTNGETGLLKGNVTLVI